MHDEVLGRPRSRRAAISPIRIAVEYLSAAVLALYVSRTPIHAAEPAPAETLADGLYAFIDTERGGVTIELFFEDAPLTVTNFVGLAEGHLGPSDRRGTPFYDGLIFHRVVPGFVVQGGDPKGTGAGGPGYAFQDELNPKLRFGEAGMVGMANSGPDTNGSQFFIVLAEKNRLNYNYSVFGPPLPPMADNPEFLISGEGVPIGASFSEWINLKLHHYEAVTGHRVYARVYSGFLPRNPEDSISAFCKDTAEKLETGFVNGVLISYFSDENAWNIRIGERLLPLFMDSPMEVADFVAGGMDSRLHKKKKALLSGGRRLSGIGEPGQAVDAVITAVIEELDL
jgi:cyclophilin family peptidyl-prolyl cis-trans isomerase